MSASFSLARQNTLLLSAAFIIVELLTVAALVLFLILPLAQRSADDLAGLMMLSAQTWAELPPQTRPAFEIELLASHGLALRAESAGRGQDEWRPPYFYLLEDALERRTGMRQHLTKERVGDATWYWANLLAGEERLAVGLPQQRVDTQPLLALLLALGGGLTLAATSAYWFARRITAPLARLDQAATRIGQGQSPELLSESGPRELAALTRRFNSMARQVRELLQARVTLLAGVSHDLRTPLARMLLALEMLKSGPTPALISRLEKDIAEIDGLIATLLDLARGLEREPPETLDLASFLVELGSDFSTPERMVTVSCSPCRRCVPRRALRRAIGNLLQNALRYAPDGPVNLVCELRLAGCTVSVLDRGPGIAPERIEEMFQPFHRLDASRSPATGGAGLGLAIVRELARANGWQVTLESRAGGGLAAEIVLPEVRAQ